jgi:hypothetical protein
VDIALGHIIRPPGFDLNAEPLESLDVNKRPPHIVKLENAQHHAQLLAIIFLWQPIRVYSCRRHETADHIRGANEIDVANLRWQHQWTIDSLFKST